MNNQLINEILLTIAVLATGIIYGTDGFHVIANKKAISLSKDTSLADLVGHTHLIADKRMPVIGITSILSTAIFIFINLTNLKLVAFSGLALTMLFAHVALYLTVAKPVNEQMSAAAVNNIVTENIRNLQKRWDSIIVYRFIFLATSMLGLLISMMNI